MGDPIAHTIRTATHGMGVVSTSLYALPRYGCSVVNRHLDVRDYSRRCNVRFESCYPVRRALFSLPRDTVLSSATDCDRSVACPLRKRLRMPGSHSARALWSKELYYVCICAGESLRTALPRIAEIREGGRLYSQFRPAAGRQLRPDDRNLSRHITGHSRIYAF